MRQIILCALLILAVALLIKQSIGGIKNATVNEIVKMVPVEKVRYITVTGSVPTVTGPGKIEKAPYSIKLREKEPGGEFVLDGEQSVIPEGMTVAKVETSHKIDWLAPIRLGAAFTYKDAKIETKPFLAYNVRVYGALEAGVGTDGEDVYIDVGFRYKNVVAIMIVNNRITTVGLGCGLKLF